jgi:hypothetical protein
MPSTIDLRYAFNRGEIGKLALGRVDRDAARLAASTCLNWMPLAQGPMMLRPGSAYLGQTKDNGTAHLLPFIFSRTDTALIELTDQAMRVWVDDELVVRPDISTSISNGAFSASAGWTLTATDGATSVISGGSLTLTATARGSSASARQTVTVPVDSQGIEHALRVVVTRGPVFFKVGIEIGTDDLVKRTKLGTGTHSLSFTPSTKFTVEFESTDRAARIVDSCDLEDDATLELPTVWEDEDFDQLQYCQSGDIIFLASDGHPQKKIERRATTAWSVVDYEGLLGPMRFPNSREEDISLSVDTYEGNGSITADAPFFTSDHVGMIFRLSPRGQTKETKMAGEDTWSEPIRIAGVGADRVFQIEVSGTWSGTLTIQSSLDGPTTGFSDARSYSGSGPALTVNGTFTVNDSANYANSVVWYRVGFKSGDYQGGVATTSFTGNGSQGRNNSDAVDAVGGPGFIKVLSVNSTTSANIEVLKPISSIAKTKDWLIGEWGGEDGYPTAVTLFDGRLWWGGKDRLWGSVSDDYENFDYDFEGDSGPISRSIGTGPVATIVWLLSLARLMAGRGGAVSSVRSSNFDEPLTPTNFTIKDASTRGAASTRPGQIDSRGVYIHANGRQLFELSYRVDAQDYSATDLTHYHQDIGLPGFNHLAVARSPDNRVFIVRNDGQLAAVLREQDGDANLASWWRISRDGNYESVAVLPGDLEDKVYVVVQTEIDGTTKRFLEVFARRDECTGEPVTKCLDSHIIYSGSATKTITGLDHLEGETVSVWGAALSTDDNGRDLGTYTVSGGSIGLLPIDVTTAVVGLPYTASFESSKLAYGAELSLGTIKRINQISFVLFDAHAQSLSFGPDFDTLEPLPFVEDGEDVDTDYVWSHYDKKVTSFPGRWDGDTRICLQAAGPRPVTVGAAMISVDVSGRTN